jgi:S1-C subfamily serine protease
MKKVLRSPFPSSLLGGVIVAVALLLAGVGGTKKVTTVVEQAPLAAANASSSSGGGLTPREIYKRDAPGVVAVRAQVVNQSPSPFDLFPQSEQGVQSGSGFVIDDRGTILTNAHVVDGAVKVTVQFADNKLIDASVVGKDQSSDLALLRVNPDGLNLHPLPLGDSSTVQVGDPTVAIGNPFGLDRTLTTGVVSALQRQITAPNQFEINNVIQTDAPINPGNSGGPLIDALGRVIGINSQIETGGGNGGGQGGSVGIGFAVPINTAKQVIPQLEKNGRVQEAYLGLTSITIDQSLAQLNLPVRSGALVESVVRGSPAAKAGIQGGNITANFEGGEIQLGGDIVTSVDGQAISAGNDLATLIGKHKPGDKVALGVLRGGKHLTLDATLGTRPNSAPQTG